MNKVQQKFDRSIREAMTVKPRLKPRAVPVDPSKYQEPESDSRFGWKLRLDPITGATIWGPVD